MDKERQAVTPCGNARQKESRERVGRETNRAWSHSLFTLFLLIVAVFFQVGARAAEQVIDPVALGYSWMTISNTPVIPTYIVSDTLDQAMGDVIEQMAAIAPAECFLRVSTDTNGNVNVGFLRARIGGGFEVCVSAGVGVELTRDIGVLGAGCPEGYALANNKCLPNGKPKIGKQRNCAGSVGNPINPATGNKFQTETDYEAQGLSGLEFFKSYNSNQTGGRLERWTFAYSQRLVVFASTAVLKRPDGGVFYFVQSGSDWLADSDIVARLVRLTDSLGTLTGWRYTAEDDSVETYDATGKLLTIKSRAGLTQTLSYSDATTPTTIAPRAGLLIKVADPFGRSLNFTYNPAGRLSTLTDPAGGVFRYAYDTEHNLTSVTFPDATPDTPSKRNYVYDQPIIIGGNAQPHALTGIVDENGVRYATYKYDDNGRAISTEHAGGVEKFALSYTSDASGNPVSTSVTDPLGSVRTNHFATVLGVVKNTGSDQPGGSGCAAAASALTYDANGNIASRTDFNGHRTNYSYDLTRNLETSRTEGLTAAGASTPETRTIITEWHPTFRLPTKTIEPGLETTVNYDSKGHITHKSLKDLVTAKTQDWNTTYTYAPSGILLQKVEDGPRTDVSDITTYDYYPEDAVCASGN